MVRMAVQRDAGQAAGEPIQELVGKPVGSDRIGLLAVHRQLTGRAQPDDGRDVEGPGAEAVFLAAAQDLGRDAGPQGLGPQVQRAGALGTVELMRGEAQGVDPQTVHVDRQLADPLCGVAVEQGAAGRADPGQVGNRVERVDHAVGGLDRNQPGVGGPCGLQRIGVDLAQPIGPQPGDADAAGLLEAPDRLGHGLVFDRRRDDVARRALPAVSPEIARLLASVAEAVKTIWPERPPSSLATELRLCWTASRAARPRTWPLAGLPNCSRSRGSIAARTASSRGVVALLSR